MPIPYELLEQIRNGSLAITDLLDSTRDSSREDQIEILSLDLKSHWDKPSQRTVEDYLKLIPDLASAPELLVPLIVAEYSARIDSGELPTQSEYLLRFPSLQTELKNALDPNALHPTTTISTMFSSKDSPKILANRYKLIERVGAGSFGEVFMALDMKLERPVAIKAPKKIESGSSPSNEYLSEARTLAKFEHPNIVSIYDIGTTPEGETYFVTQYVKGGTLKDNASKFQGNFDKIATAFSQLADALNFAHQRRIIHRDIKPANILIDAKTEKPLVADFGLAILQEDLSQSHRTGGSLAYMSPEQIRGENHRLDGRSDIFSLGVVLYELLTGQLPFLGSQGEIVTAILHSDPAPPCSIDPSIPSELERICLKALSKSPGDRYSHASLMAEDLRTWNTATPAKTVSDDKVEIIPKGLRSFDEKDAGFFLSLLPGQRNREGLPESIAFWKEKIQQRDPDKTFSVGLIYGPSGCGKSSLVKAGLLPNLSKDILAIYVEATPEETETRILNGLKKAIPKLGTAEGKPLDLAEVLKALRKATGSRRQKVVLVLDQFEQWLHGHDDYATATLTDALRQCDGANVQAIILVREDFWVSISRFLKQIDIPITERSNSAMVDLFDLDHAKRVLGMFGKAYSKLGSQDAQWTAPQREFVDTAIDGLAENRKIISVRLALFADMMKTRDWTPESILEVGGVSGVGVRFLEETFGDRHAAIQYKVHQEAVRGFLSALLPAVGTDIKGTKQTQDALRQACGYRDKPNEFAELTKILDSDLRLITPVDEIGGVPSYQLTHDYLVPSLRQWLTRKQRETKKGRAELKLAERAATWGANQENKQLPTLWEWLQIRRWTEKSKWAPSEKQLMQRSGSFHLRRTSAIMASILMLALGMGWIWNRIEVQRKQSLAASSTESLLTADYANLKEILSKIGPQSKWIADDLKSAASNPAFPREKQMRGLLGLAQIGKPISQQEWTTVAKGMLELPPASLLIVRDLLGSHSESLRGSFETAIQEELSGDGTHRLLAAAALALFDRDNPKWKGDLWPAWVAQGIAVTNPSHVDTWIKAFRPVSDIMVPALQKQFLSEGGSEISKRLLTNVLTDYAQADAKLLANTLSEANADNFPSYLAGVKKLGDKGIAELTEILDSKLEPDWKDRPIDPSWKSIDKETKAKIERAKGMLHERFAFVQAMPIGEFVGVAEVLRGGGYRPTRVRPWAWQLASGDAQDNTEKPIETLIASVFVRDGLDWKIDLDVSKSDLPTKDVPAIKDGYMIVDLAALPNANDKSPRFVALWVALTDASNNRRVLVDLTEDELRQEDSELGKSMGVVKLSVSINNSEERRYCAIYSEEAPVYEFYWRRQAGDYLDRPQTDLSISKPRSRNFDLIASLKKKTKDYETLDDLQKQDFVKQTGNANDLARAYFLLSDFERSLAVCRAGLEVFPVDDALHLTELLSLVAASRSNDAIFAMDEYRKKYSKSESSVAYAEIQFLFFSEGEDAAKKATSLYREKFRDSKEDLYDVFCAVALCAKYSVTEREKESRIQESFDILERLIAIGYDDYDHITTDPDLIALHDQNQFDSALNMLSAPVSMAGIWPVNTSIETKVIPTNLHETGRGWLDAMQITSLSEQNWRPLAISLADWGRDATDPLLPYATIVLSRPTIPDAQKESLAKQQARAAVALFQLGKIELVAELMRTEQPDARVRSYFQAYLTEMKSDPATLLAEFLNRAPATRSGESIKSPATASLAISLGDFAEAKLLTAEQIEATLLHALKLVAEDIDPGVHGACGWLIKKLGRAEEMDRVLSDLSTGTVEGDRRWYQTKTSGHTFAIFEPAEVLMGSPITEAQRYGGPKSTNERLHRRKGGYRFAVATHETTVEQFSRFRKNHSFNREYSREERSPANVINWYDAVAYCNWLSQQEGIAEDQWCYTIDPQDPMKVQMAADFMSRRGYRLPTEFEWEYACRAESRTSRPHGETKELLTRYAWYADNSGTEFTMPVGTLRPNDFGMFDMFGNIFEWNQEFYEPYSSNYINTANPTQSLKVDKEMLRLLRGGSFNNQALFVRSAVRLTSPPDIRSYIFGFRASRTYD